MTVVVRLSILAPIWESGTRQLPADAAAPKQDFRNSENYRRRGCELLEKLREAKVLNALPLKEWKSTSLVGLKSVSPMSSRRLPSCYETLSSLRDSASFFQLPSTAPPAACWARLSRAYGALFRCGLFHRCDGQPSFVIASCARRDGEPSFVIASCARRDGQPSFVTASYARRDGQPSFVIASCAPG